MTRSVLPSAFQGLGLVARRPSVLVVWPLVLLFGLAAPSLFVEIADLLVLAPPGNDVSWQTLFELARGGAWGEVTALAVETMPLARWGASALGVLWSLALFGVFAAAVCRAVLQPESPAPAYLRFGRDEARQAALLIGAFVVMGSGVLLASLILGALGAAIHPMLGDWGDVALALLLALPWVLLTPVALRLSLAAPLTFDRGELRLFSAWRVGRGRTLPLIGVGVIVLVLVTALAALLGLAGYGVLWVFGGPLGPDVTVLGDVGDAPPLLLDLPYHPEGLLFFVLDAIVVALVLLVSLPPWAGAYRVLARSAPEA